MVASAIWAAGPIGYGLLLTGFGVGGLLGSLLASRLSRQLGPGTVLVAGPLVRAATWLIFGLCTSLWLGGAMLALVGATGMISNVVGVSLRQAIVPDHLVGRVVSADRMLAYGAAPLGAILGGLVGRTLGVQAPFLLGAAILAAAGLLALTAINNHTIQAARHQAQITSRTSSA